MNPWLMLFSSLPAIIRFAEQLLPESTGLEKSAAVITQATQIVGDIGDKLPALQAHISNIVSIYNSTDSLFGKILGEITEVESTVNTVAQTVTTVTQTAAPTIKVNLQPGQTNLTA